MTDPMRPVTRLIVVGFTEERRCGESVSGREKDERDHCRSAERWPSGEVLSRSV
jgi:hypothetical protein